MIKGQNLFAFDLDSCYVFFTWHFRTTLQHFWPSPFKILYILEIQWMLLSKSNLYPLGQSLHPLIQLNTCNATSESSISSISYLSPLTISGGAQCQLLVTLCQLA